MAIRLPKKSRREPKKPDLRTTLQAAGYETVEGAEVVNEAIKKAAGRKEATQLAKERHARIAAYQWKPGQSGNPMGRPPGSASIVQWLKKRLAGPAFKRPDKFASLAQELADVICRQARKANFNFVQLLLDRAESRQLTEEEMMQYTEKFYNIACKYVDDPAVRKNIARDLGIDATEKEKYE